MRSTLIVAVAGLGAFGFPRMTWANSYSYQIVDVPGSYETALAGINESNGSFTILPSVLGSPNAINDSGGDSRSKQKLSV